ncbi:MAG: trehalose-phosphatase [Chloroflexota bacterium]
MYESVSRGANGLLVHDVVELLSSGRAGLVSDVDGTISPIAATPEDARVSPIAREALGILRHKLTLVAVVSGRTAAEARAMVGVDGITCIGNHGFEMLTESGRDPDIVPAARPWVPRIAAVLARARTQIRQPGIMLENKGATASLHYRGATDPEAARHELLELLLQTAVPTGLRFEEGRMVFNLLPPLDVSKGSAVKRLAAEWQLDRLVYLGDDETDADAFQALHELRQSGEARTLSIAVVGSETPARVRDLADATLPSVQAVAQLLACVAELFKSEC